MFEYFYKQKLNYSWKKKSASSKLFSRQYYFGLDEKTQLRIRSKSVDL